jgi:hypothetical protein
VLYECLLGTEPLRIAVQRSRESATGDPFPGLERLLPDHPLGPPLATFLSRALSRDVHQRPASARDFGDGLRQLSGRVPMPVYETGHSDV